jgi:hypothetical protein
MTFIPDWDKMPKTAPPASKADKIIDAIALIGVLLTFFITIMGAVILPYIIPAYYNQSRGGDVYVSIMFLFFTIFFYAFLTVVIRYPYYFNYPTRLTKENALRQYGIACSMVRRMKAILIWLFVTLDWFLVLLLPNNPGLSNLSISLSITLPFIIVFAVLVIYSAKTLIREGKPKNTQA